VVLNVLLDRQDLIIRALESGHQNSVIPLRRLDLPWPLAPAYSRYALASPFRDR
jgi:hypothetical protein